MSILEINDKNFKEEVLESEKLILCDFWAEWCGPCKQISPILEELSEEFKNELTVAKINIDNNPEVPSSYNIMSIPTLLLIKKGEIVGTQIGLQSKDDLKTWINEKIN